MAAPSTASSTTFADNLSLPVHRWFRYSAGYSADWAKQEIETRKRDGLVVLDPFLGSGTTCFAAQEAGVASVGLEPHSLVLRIARAKAQWVSDIAAFTDRADAIIALARATTPDLSRYPGVIRRSFSDEALQPLDQIRRAWTALDDGTPASELTWLAMVGILRSVSHVGTAPWQYLLPSREKAKTIDPWVAFAKQTEMVAGDMRAMRQQNPASVLVLDSDARTCAGVADNSIGLVVTSPPYANNYDYADATRLEMSFLGEVQGWGDLQEAVRKHLVRSCSQSVTDKTVNIETVLAEPLLAPIADDLRAACELLAAERENHGGKKNYHLMAVSYFLDMANVWQALGRVCEPGAEVCWVVGDSAPYGVYLDVYGWNGRLALASGFSSWSFDKTRDRNIKWKNRKHQVPLSEGRMWVR